MKKTGRWPRKKALAPGGPIRKKPRTAAERERIYGPKGRTAFVKSLPCKNCEIESGYYTKIVNAHIETGGEGYKAGYRKIIPLCATIWREGCHDKQHQHGWEALPNLATVEQREAAATETEQAWQDHLSYVRSRQGRTTGRRSA